MENSRKSFMENFYTCCIDSCDRLAHERASTDPVCVEASEEYDVIFHTIADKLGDGYGLMLDYETALHRNLGRRDDFIYQQGFQDCVELLRWMGAL